MSSAKLGNQDRPQNGKQVMQAPAWEIGEAGRQVGVPAGPENTDMVCREDFEDWSQEQYNERQLGNLLDYQLMNEMDSRIPLVEWRKVGLGTTKYRGQKAQLALFGSRNTNPTTWYPRWEARR